MISSRKHHYIEKPNKECQFILAHLTTKIKMRLLTEKKHKEGIFFVLFNLVLILTAGAASIDATFSCTTTRDVHQSAENC